MKKILIRFIGCLAFMSMFMVVAACGNNKQPENILFKAGSKMVYDYVKVSWTGAINVGDNDGGNTNYTPEEYLELYKERFVITYNVLSPELINMNMTGAEIKVKIEDYFKNQTSKLDFFKTITCLFGEGKVTVTQAEKSQELTAVYANNSATVKDDKGEVVFIINGGNNIYTIDPNLTVKDLIPVVTGTNGSALSVPFEIFVSYKAVA